MRVLVATDAWHPQVNGVVRTLTSLAARARSLGVTIEFLTPDGFPSLPLPTYRGLRLALPNRREIARRIERPEPDAIHIATEGPIGHAVRAYCLREARPFTTSYTTRFPEYIAARVPIPESWSYAVLRRFHARGHRHHGVDAVADDELAQRGFSNLGMWTRGVDTDLFSPEHAIDLDLPRPIFVSVGRVAVEKNLEAFLSLDLPGSKVVIGDGPQEAELRRRFPDAKFLGLHGEPHARGHLAAADVFVFPSRTDTFGVVQLEALACGVPVAAFPVDRPAGRDRQPSGRRAARRSARGLPRRAARSPREACRAFALTRSWETAPGSSSAMSSKWRSQARSGRADRAWQPASLPSQAAWQGAQQCRIVRTQWSAGNESSGGAVSSTRTRSHKAYARWAPVYDLVFGAVFERGRRAAIAAAERIGGRILEVGVGTGISLPDYSRNNRLFGIDISEPMLRKAQERVDELGLDQCRGARGDGCRAPVAFRTPRSTSWWRNTSSPRCRIRRRRSTSSPACSSPAARSCW